MMAISSVDGAAMRRFAWSFGLPFMAHHRPSIQHTHDRAFAFMPDISALAFRTKTDPNGLI